MNYDAGNGFAGGAPANSGWQQASYNIGQSNVSSLQAFQGSRVLHHQGRNFATMGDTLACVPTQRQARYTGGKTSKAIWKKREVSWRPLRPTLFKLAIGRIQMR
jgi:hypothetical protein